MTSYTDEQVLNAAVWVEADGSKHCGNVIRSILADRTRLQAAIDVELVDLEMTLQAVVAQDPREEIILRLSDQKRRISQAIDSARAKKT